MSIGESIIALFENNNILTVVLWVAGLLLVFIEFFQPMRGVGYILGVLLIGASLTVRSIIGSPGEAFIFVWFTAILVFVVHIVSLATQKRDWLRAAKLKKAGERNKKYLSLIGCTGAAVTPIDLVGTVSVNDVMLVAYSDEPIRSGERVRIVKVAADKIMVEKLNEFNSEESI